MTVTEAERVATIRGVALSPGVSKNGRRYTKENIGNAHKRLTARLADPNGRPVVMRTYHPGNYSDHQAVTNIAGRLTAASLDDKGALHFEADIADTAVGKDVASLVTSAQPYLRNVSIRGWWIDEPVIDGQGCETAHDLEIDGLDFVTNPGVEAAQILTASLAESAARHPISESVEDPTVTLIDEPPKPAGPLKEAAALVAQLQEAMACVSVSNGPADISVAAYGNDPADLPAIVGRLSAAVQAALDAVDPDSDGDIDLPESTEAAPIQGSPTGESATQGDAPVSNPSNPEGFAGMTQGVPNPHNGTPAVVPAPAVEAAPVAPAVAAAPAAPAPAAPAAEAAPVADGATAPTLSEADLTAIAAKVAEAMKPADPAAPAVEATTVVPEAAATAAPVYTAEQASEMVKQAVREAAGEMKAALTDEAIALIRSGGRKGVVRPTDESGAPKAIHEMSEEERNAYAADAWGAVLARHPA